jgi:D-beta-D-heptose 7-phosphate kinase / D-beta-D-heptose 1-phosphate adenosyltransferase
MRKSKELTEIISEFSTENILVIGDLIIDVYLTGTSTRLTPEAPVPVVDVEQKKIVLGGAANVVCNLKKLGASVAFATVIGSDEEGRMAEMMLDDLDVQRVMMVRSDERRTLVKTRVIAGGHVITRFDQGSCEAISGSPEDALIASLASRGRWDAVIVSDYDKGIITERVVNAIKEMKKHTDVLIAVDSKRLGFFQGLQPTLVKPNYHEALKLLNLAPISENRKKQIAPFGKDLFEKTGAELVAVTFDEEGSIVMKNGKIQSTEPALKIPSPQVSGAGDTFMATFVLAYCTCQNIRQSNELASAAASVVVSKEATSTCSHDELLLHFNSHVKTISSLNELDALAHKYRSEGRRIVFTNGCFDILHSGHVSYLQSAKKLGDVLIVGINDDGSIKRLKGAQRPINPLNDRLQVLAALTAVDHVISFGSELDDTPTPLIEIIQPDIFVKGGDYTKAQLPEAPTVEKHGGKVVIVPAVPDHSTSRIIQQIRQDKSIIKKAINS